MLDQALETLFQFLQSEEQLLAAARDVLFLRAKDCPQLQLFAGKNLQCEQTFRPDFDVLMKRGLNTVSEKNGKFDLCLALGSKQRDENFIQFVEAVDALKEGGTFVCCLPKELGAGRFEKELKRAGGEELLFVKNHCRVFGLKRTQPLHEEVLAGWRALRELRPVAGTTLLSRPGIFGWDKIDKGSELLVATLPKLRGKVADFGSGYGFLADYVLASSEHVGELHLFEAEKLALDASRQTFREHALASKLHFHWHDLTAGLAEKNFDAIVANPPFHTGRQMNIALGQKFVEVAAGALKRDGEFYMVANSSLPYEHTLAKKFRSYSQLAQGKGFKVLKAVA